MKWKSFFIADKYNNLFYIFIFSLLSFIVVIMAEEINLSGQSAICVICAKINEHRLLGTDISISIQQILINQYSYTVLIVKKDFRLLKML